MVSDLTKRWIFEHEVDVMDFYTLVNPHSRTSNSCDYYNLHLKRTFCHSRMVCKITSCFKGTVQFDWLRSIEGVDGARGRAVEFL